MLRPSPRRAFYVVVARNGTGHEDWCWEIRRKWKPLGVRLWEGGFRSYRAADLAGRSKLEDLLNGLCIDAGS